MLKTQMRLVFSSAFEHFVTSLCYQRYIKYVHPKAFLIESFRGLEVAVQTPARIFMCHDIDKAGISQVIMKLDPINFEHSSVTYTLQYTSQLLPHSCICTEGQGPGSTEDMWSCL